MFRNTSVRFIMSLSFLIAAFGFACGDDPPTSSGSGAGEEELITTATITLTPQGGGPAITVQFKDLDGDGGNAPTIDTLTVTLGTTYNGTILLQNEAETPAEDITAEVKNEAEEHQFFYTTGGGFASASVTVTDKESDYGTNTGSDLPVGIAFTLTVPAGTGNGTFRAVLSHFDDVAKDGSTQSNESDLDVTFTVIVQ